MEKKYFVSAGIAPPQATEFEATLPVGWNGPNCMAAQSFLDHSYGVDQYSRMEPALSPGLSSKALIVHELLGKLGGAAAVPQSVVNCYRAPLSCPTELDLPNTDHFNAPNLGFSVPVSPIPSFSTDPGFAERAAKYSCFGRWSFNGRSAPFAEMHNAELLHKSGNQLLENGKLSRVSSSPSLKQDGSPVTKPRNSGQNQVEPDKKLGSSNEKSSVSEQIPCAETGSKTSNEMNSRKRKPASKAKDGPISTKVGNEIEENPDNKRSKSTTEDQKAAEPPKDYIHVRARRGQATDSHSLAERVRREKISERMKLLQDLVPGCNKVTGKALMLDEIINYVQSLQRQVEFLSMKLASVNPGPDSAIENFLSKDMFQSNAALSKHMYNLDAPASAFLSHPQNVQILHNPSAPSKPMNQNLNIDGFDFPEFGEGDLHSIFQMDQALNM